MEANKMGPCTNWMGQCMAARERYENALADLQDAEKNADRALREADSRIDAARSVDFLRRRGGSASTGHGNSAAGAENIHCSLLYTVYVCALSVSAVSKPFVKWNADWDYQLLPGRDLPCFSIHRLYVRTASDMEAGDTVGGCIPAGAYFCLD